MQVKTQFFRTGSAAPYIYNLLCRRPGRYGAFLKICERKMFLHFLHRKIARLIHYKTQITNAPACLRDQYFPQRRCMKPVGDIKPAPFIAHLPRRHALNTDKQVMQTARAGQPAFMRGVKQAMPGGKQLFRITGAHILLQVLRGDPDFFFKELLEMRDFISGASGKKIQRQRLIVMRDQIINALGDDLHGNILHKKGIALYYPFANPFPVISHDALVLDRKIFYTATMNKQDVHEFFRRLQERNPEPVGELNYINTYTLLVAVVLSAQATDKGVNKATESLFKVADTPEKMLRLGEEGLKEHIKTIGLFNSKAKNVIKLSQILASEHGGKVPQTREALVKLPGVGRKTANVVLNIAFGLPTIAVDTHIFRVSNRTGLAPGKTPEQVEEKLEKTIPDEFKRHAHHWLILHGRYICTARKPKCGECPVYDLCAYKDKTA